MRHLMKATFAVMIVAAAALLFMMPQIADAG
jgi:hypothetical protein